MYNPERVDVRRIMCREGLQLECENQLLQLQEYSLKEAREHVEEREQIAKNYMLECERSNKYQHHCENLDSENDALKAQLKLWKEKEIAHIEHMSDLDLEKVILFALFLFPVTFAFLYFIIFILFFTLP